LILAFLVGPHVFTRVLQCGRNRQQSRAKYLTVRELDLWLLALKVEEEGHRHQLLLPEKVKETHSSLGTQKTHSLALTLL
jgi:hypothetical protein